MKTTLFVLALSGTLLLAQSPAKKAVPAVPPAKAAPAAPPAKVADKPAAAPVASAFIGNKESKILHKADCAMAGKMKPDNKAAFATKAEAEKAGYKACKTCKP